ncbi:MAG: response regulator transcription factor [Dehalococcoidia bacterium]|nr:MAG: response regulator transcription factor [Dehalococcoidia bacterium]
MKLLLGAVKPTVEEGKVKKDIRIVLVDDHEIVRRGLRRMLELEKDIKVVADCANANEAFSQVEKLSPDIILMDIKMPEVNGVEATRVLKEKKPACKIIMLTLYDEYIVQSIEAGADGYLLKDARCTELTQAIRQVYQSKRPQEECGELVEDVDLVMPPSADIARVMAFIVQVEKMLGASVRQTIGSKERGTVVTVLLKPTSPAILLHKLQSVPNVQKVEEQRTSPRRRVLVTLK